ncbi:MAG: hypothetical protein ACYDH9_24000 [Limisphaerales bacterium]
MKVFSGALIFMLDYQIAVGVALLRVVLVAWLPAMVLRPVLRPVLGSGGTGQIARGQPGRL